MVGWRLFGIFQFWIKKKKCMDVAQKPDVNSVYDMVNRYQSSLWVLTHGSQIAPAAGSAAAVPSPQLEREGQNTTISIYAFEMLAVLLAL